MSAPSTRSRARLDGRRRSRVARPRRAACPTPDVDAELLLAHVLGIWPRRGAGEGRSPARRSTPSDASRFDELRRRAVPRASRCSTSPASRRSARSSSPSGPASSCRGPRPRASRSSPSTRSRAVAAAVADRRRPRHRQRCDRARHGHRGAARRRCTPSRSRPTPFVWTQQQLRAIGADNARLVVRRPRRRRSPSSTAPSRSSCRTRRTSRSATIPRDPEVRLLRPGARALRRRGRPRRRARRSRRRARRAAARRAARS